MTTSPVVRLAVDIGGTFTDVALTVDGRRETAKVLTTPTAPEDGVINGVGRALERAGIGAGDVDIMIHGTTLATNALIERKGATTALITTEGFRDSLEMAYENRFEQYDIWMERPRPLVPRERRLTVPERIDAQGNVLVPLDEAAVEALVPVLRAAEVESVAVGFLHSYVDPAHERRVRDILRAAMPDLWISLSSDVCPEMREYERFSTTCANAYVQPVMAGYLGRLRERLGEMGLACPVVLMTSGGGLTALETARQLPIRLVESGPAGGAILAGRTATQCGYDRVVSFDMGGTTAKICLIDDGQPLQSRTFEVAREYRFLAGSGLPLRIPVIEMVEIGAGGGSIARVDAMKRITVGPDSASSEPGPVCYGRGGTEPTVTDSNVVLGRIDPDLFAGGTMKLDRPAAAAALERQVGGALGGDAVTAAYGVVEVVNENMANAGRVHAVERAKDLADRTMIAFGGAAPLHAVRLAQKLDIPRVVIPSGAGVGSAVGFLLAPVTYEIARSLYMRLDAFDAARVEALFGEMRAEAEEVVRQTAPDAALVEARTADMRYVGQGHEIVVELPEGTIGADDLAGLEAAFREAYEQLFGRTIPGLDVEVLNWTLKLEAPAVELEPCPPRPADIAAEPAGTRRLEDPERGEAVDAPAYRREDLAPGARLAGPAVIYEDDTTTVVLPGYDARIDGLGNIVIERDGLEESTR